MKVLALSAEQKRELVDAKDKEFNTFVKCSAVEAASRQGISPRRSRQIFLTFAASLWFSNSQRIRVVCIFSGGLGRAT